MQLDIVTPEKTLYSGEVNEIVANTADGEVGILPHHINLITKLIPGELIIKANKKQEFIGITDGFLQVNDNHVTVLADYAVHARDIDVEQAIAAQKRAEKILKEKREGISEQDFAVAQADLRRAIMELKVARRGHHPAGLPQ